MCARQARKAIVVASALALGLMAWLPAAFANETSQKLIAEVEPLMKAASPDHRQILEKLQAATAADPGDARAAFAYGAYLVTMHAARPALDQLNKAAKLDPAIPNLQFFRGRALADLGRSKDALAAYMREPNKDGNRLLPFYRGLVRKDLKSYPAALADFDRSDAVHPPGRQATQFHRGDIYLLQRKPEQAAAAYADVVKLAPRSPVAETARERLKRLGKPVPGDAPSSAVQPAPGAR
jgi:tetratricopeptide (TPR) repeat protein